MSHALESDFLPSASEMSTVAECPGMPALKQRLHHEGRLLDLGSPASERGSEGHLGIAGEEYDEEVVEEASVEEANALETSMYRDWLERIGDERIGDPVREERLFGHIGVEPIFTAKPDMHVQSLDSPRGLVIDHKLGFEEVPPPAVNLQIWTQVAAIAENKGLEEVSADICQPAIWKQPRLAVYSGLVLRAAVNTVRRISLTSIYHPKLIAGPHCGSCPARSGCMTGIAWANRQKQFAAEIVDKVATLDPVRSDMVYEGLGSAIKILAATKKLLVARKREDSSFMSGYKFISGRRSVENTALAIARLEDEGISRNVLESALKFSVSQVDKLIQKHFRIPEQAAKEKLSGILSGLINTAEPSLRRKNSKELAE